MFVARVYMVDDADPGTLFDSGFGLFLNACKFLLGDVVTSSRPG